MRAVGRSKAVERLLKVFKRQDYVLFRRGCACSSCQLGCMQSIETHVPLRIRLVAWLKLPKVVCIMYVSDNGPGTTIMTKVPVDHRLCQQLRRLLSTTGREHSNTLQGGAPIPSSFGYCTHCTLTRHDTNTTTGAAPCAPTTTARTGIHSTGATGIYVCSSPAPTG